MRTFLFLLMVGFLWSANVLPVVADDEFDFAKERSELWEWLADEHADLGDDYAKYEIYDEAHRQYNRARELVKDHKGAMKGLGFKFRKGEWVAHKQLPKETELSNEVLVEARKRPDRKRDKFTQKAVKKIRKLIEEAKAVDDDHAQKVFALDLLFYAKDDADARALRGHVRDDAGNWIPKFAYEWRNAGKKALKDAGEGEKSETKDPWATTLGTTFARRQSDYLVVRVSGDDARARNLHRAVEACVNRTVVLLGIEGAPFGEGRAFTLTELEREEYMTMLEKVLKLKGDKLDFNKRLSGTFHSDPWGFVTRSFDTTSNDLCSNSTVLQILRLNQRAKNGFATWVKTGFSYMITAQVLNSTLTKRYTLKDVGQTATSHEVIPEFTKKSGDPALLREVALYDVNFGRDVALEELVDVEINDLTQHHASKAFALMEFFFLKYPEKAAAWLTSASSAKGKRVAALGSAFGKPLTALESEWRKWVLENY